MGARAGTDEMHNRRGLRGFGRRIARASAGRWGKPFGVAWGRSRTAALRKARLRCSRISSRTQPSSIHQCGDC